MAAERQKGEKMQKIKLLLEVEVMNQLELVQLLALLLAALFAGICIGSVLKSFIQYSDAWDKGYTKGYREGFLKGCEYKKERHNDAKA